MTNAETPKSPPRGPQVFEVTEATIEAKTSGRADAKDRVSPGEIRVRPTAQEWNTGIRWGAILISALAGLAGLAAGLAFGRFVSAAFERQDWVGWLAFGLGTLALVASVVLVLREIVGLMRLGRLHALNEAVATALARKDVRAERSAVAALQRLLAHRADCRWGLARLAEHAGDGRDPGDLLRLADREVMAPLDGQARRQILKSAKRVATVTAISPMAWIAMLFVAIENLRMLRTLATLYGGRPGFTGTMKLARLVLGHIVATGGVAMTDDLLGQFLGQDLLRRLSRRLGEGAFNGALTARIGVAALTVTRPLPFLDAPEIRVRDLVPEIFRRIKAAEEPGATNRQAF
ncbi:MAG: TIGR01620 family protein [Hyphomicrobium sp.]|nr:TIGR01620 family protein [Hyphomicrobium sp.]